MVRFRKVSIFSSPGAAVLFFLQKRKKRMGAQNVLAEKEKNGFKKRAFGRGGNRKKRADRVVRPYGCRGRSEKLADRVVRPYGCGGKS